MSRPKMVKSQVNRRQVVGGAAVVGAGVPLLAACGGESDDGSDSGDTTEPAGEESPPSESGDLSTADVPEGGGVILEEKEAVVTQAAAGEFKAFSSICTHQGCAVTEVADTINCPCHGSMFSLTDGSVVDGPAPDPLPEMPITVDGDTITLG